MRTLIIVFLLTFSPGIIFSQTKFNTPIEYNDYIITQQDQVAGAINNLMNSIDLDSATIWSNFNFGLASIQVALGNIKSMPDFEGKTYFRDACVNLFQFYYESYSTDFKQMLLIYTDPTLNAEQIGEKINAIIEPINQKESLLDGIFANAQDQFARDYNFQLTPAVIDDGTEDDY